VSNVEDGVFKQVDEVVEWVRLGEQLEDGILASATVGIDLGKNYNEEMDAVQAEG
jgi:hypothetical protein